MVEVAGVWGGQTVGVGALDVDWGSHALNVVALLLGIAVTAMALEEGLWPESSAGTIDEVSEDGVGCSDEPMTSVELSLFATIWAP